MIKALFSYFVKFSKNVSILSKKYFKDYKMDRLNLKLIIMITYNKNIFSINNKCQKCGYQTNIEFFI